MVIDPGRLGERYKGLIEVVSADRPKTERALMDLTDRLNAAYGNAKDAERLIEVLVFDVKDWADEELCDLIEAITARVDTRQLEPEQLRRWIGAHDEPHERASVRRCVDVVPPSQVSVLKVLSLAGAQKVVFLCKWSVADREIVLKQFVNPTVAEAVFKRELRLHPFSMEHPNIIESHYFLNEQGEEFLAEKFIETQDEDWRANGAFEAANFLHDLASALQFVHQRGLVHGDIKPDNTGYEQSRYLLLDFGVCREKEAFDLDNPSGTMRTRAPELTTRTGPQAAPADVWALGATVYHALFGRYPLFDAGEEPPSLQDGERRAEFEDELRRRIASEFSSRVLEPLAAAPSTALGEILASVLAQEPDRRPTAEELAAMCRTRLAAQVRAFGNTSRLSARERLSQLQRYLPAEELLALLPKRKMDEIRSELRYLCSDPGLKPDEIAIAKAVLKRTVG